MKTKTCLLCGERFIPAYKNFNHQLYCGSKQDKVGCSYENWCNVKRKSSRISQNKANIKKRPVYKKLIKSLGKDREEELLSFLLKFVRPYKFKKK